MNKMFQYQSLVVLCLIIVSAFTFPLDEDISDGKTFSANLQCYAGDEFGIFQNTCPAPRTFYRREIMDNEPIRRIKTPEEYEDESSSSSSEDEEMNPRYDSMFSKYSKKSSDHCDKNCEAEFTDKKHNENWNKKDNAVKSTKNHQFEKYLKSYPDFNSNMEFNAQIVEESSESASQSAEFTNIPKLRISEDIIDHPKVEVVHVDKVVNENGKEIKISEENNNNNKEKENITTVDGNKEEVNHQATEGIKVEDQTTKEVKLADRTTTPKEALTTEFYIENTHTTAVI